ncbi:MAG: DUF4382 domain-containing protein [Chitinophagales bacterium]
MKTGKLLLIMSGTIMALFTMAMLHSCKKDNNNTTNQGKVELRMTDAPGAYDAVYIDVIGAEVHSDVHGWVTMNNVHTGIYNLLELTNGTDTVLATSDIPSGDISQICLILGSSNSVVVDGQSYPLTIPSGSESGLKINVHHEVQTGQTTQVLLDFNAGASIHQTGNGDYHLKPVIHAIVVSSTSATGAISGVISPAIFANIYIVSDSDTIGTTAGLGGQFLLQGVPVGTYSLVVDPIISTTNDLVIPGIIVTANHTTDAGLLNL